MEKEIQEIHAMLTEIVEKQRRDIQKEIDRVAQEKAEEEESRRKEREWSIFVFEENRRMEVNRKKYEDRQLAREAEREHQRQLIKNRPWWSFLLSRSKTKQITGDIKVG
jgi:hypothetical protein